MSWFSSLFGKNPFEENAKEFRRGQIENAKKPRKVEDGQFYEYGPGPYWDQSDLYTQLRLTGEKALVRDRAGDLLEVWVGGKCIYKSRNLIDAQGVLRHFMWPWEERYLKYRDYVDSRD